MDVKNLKKDKSIKDIIIKLQNKLGENYFDIVDHWEDDLTAIGVGSPLNHQILVYISTLGNRQDLYNVHLELPPAPNIDFPFTDAGQFQSVNFLKLVEIIRNHFK